MNINIMQWSTIRITCFWSMLSADIPYREGALITLVHEQGTLLHEEYLEDGVRIVAKLPARIAPCLERYRTE